MAAVPARILAGMGETIQAASKAIIEYLARGVEFAAALIIGLAAIEATLKAMMLFFQRGARSEEKNAVRLTLARWLAVALEFELAADILNTAVTPSWSDIEKLAAIATLRTALNYFLQKEIEGESAPQQRAAENQMMGSQVDPLAPGDARSGSVPQVHESR